MPLGTAPAYFNTLEGTPVVLAMITLDIFHSGWPLRECEGDRSDQDKMRRSQSTLEPAKGDHLVGTGRPRPFEVAVLKGAF